MKYLEQQNRSSPALCNKKHPAYATEYNGSLVLFTLVWKQADPLERTKLTLERKPNYSDSTRCSGCLINMMPITSPAATFTPAMKLCVKYHFTEAH